jgi:hypothetical protein
MIDVYAIRDATVAALARLTRTITVAVHRRVTS